MLQQRYCSGHLHSASGWLLPGQAQQTPLEWWQEAGGRLSCMRAEPGFGVGGSYATRTQNFHHFLKLALTKNPKKRPTAEKLLQVGGREWGRGSMLESRIFRARDQPESPSILQHPFTTQQLPRALLTQLLDKANDPHLGTPSPEDCELEVSEGSWGNVPWPSLIVGSAKVI